MRKNNVGLMAALSTLPASIVEKPDAFYVFSDDFCVCVRKYSAEKVQSAKRLWDENRSSTPKQAWHFAFRKSVSDTLFEFGVTMGEIKIKTA